MVGARILSIYAYMIFDENTSGQQRNIEVVSQAVQYAIVYSELPMCLQVSELKKGMIADTTTVYRYTND